MAKEKLTRKQILIAWIIRIVFLAVALTLVDLTPLGGNIRYYSKWVQCGSQPVQVQSWGGKAWYEATHPYPSMFRSTGRYCTPIEAERAGYSASRYERSFPNLEEACEPIPLTNGGVRYPNGKEVLWNGSILYPEGTETGRSHALANCPDYTQE